ncbi:hypothetical protein MMC11_007632 [Xylographa trunciseda]|nr:hypothetical protein [Xylographa trunciseda]
MYSSSEAPVQAGELMDTVLLNDFHRDHTEGSNERARCFFPPFPRLPAELRISIWIHVLQRHRLIRLVVTDETHQSPCEDILEQGVRRNVLGNVISGKNYKFQITTHHLLTPLLRVNRESRQVSMQFYRVHIPYDSSNGERQCYLNPEFDFIHIHPDGPSEVLADFIHDFKAYDPIGVGILNLGFGSGRPQELDLPLDPSALSPPVLSAFKTTLNHLRRVFFHSVTCGDSRMMFDCLDMKEVRFNHSYPITAATEAFDIVPDPRPIDADLDKVSIGWDPRSMACLWQLMERRFGITRKPGITEFVYHITAPFFGGHPVFSSRAGCVESLRREKVSWRSGWEKGRLWERHGYQDPDTPEKLERALIPVFGFWVLPAHAFGELPDYEFENIDEFVDIRWEMKMVVSLEKHKPQLGVFCFQ